MTRVLGLCAVILAVICIALAYRVWSDERQLMQLQESLGNASQGLPVASFRETTAPAYGVSASPGRSRGQGAAGNPAPAPATSTYVQPSPLNSLLAHLGTPEQLAWKRKQLDELPSWLPLSEAQKDALPAITLLEGVISSRADQYEQRRRQDAAQVEKLLGPELYAAWREYQGSATARRVLASLNAKLGARGLQEHTVRAMAAAMTAADHTASDKEPTSSTMQDVEANDERGRRAEQLMREAAKPYLSPEGLKLYDELQAVRLAQHESNILTQRARVIADEARAAEAVNKGAR